MESIYLAGAEDVSRASHNMQAAAQEMQRAASAFQAAVDDHKRFMDDWLSRFAGAVAPAETSSLQQICAPSPTIRTAT